MSLRDTEPRWDAVPPWDAVTLRGTVPLWGYRAAVARLRDAAAPEMKWPLLPQSWSFKSV